MTRLERLFRREAIDHKQRRLMGEVSISTSRKDSVLVFVIAAVGLALAAIAITKSYARTETVLGAVVTSRPAIKVMASRPGRVARLQVSEGDVVTTGQPVAVVLIDSAAGDSQVGSQGALIALDNQKKIVGDQLELSRRQAHDEASRLEQAIRFAIDEDSSLATQLSFQEEVTKSAKVLYDLMSGAAVESGYVPRAEFERRRQSYFQEQQRLVQLNQQRTRGRAQRKEYEAQLGKARTDGMARVSELAMSIQVLEQQRAKLRSEVDYIVTSPIAGRVTALQISQGRSVDMQVPLMVILPVDARFEVELYAPTRAVGLVKVGQEVRVMYDAFPHRTYGSYKARISEISRSIATPAEVDAPLKLEEAVYRIRARIDKSPIGTADLPLQSGMTLQASLVLERQTLWERFFSPLSAVRARS